MASENMRRWFINVAVSFDGKISKKGEMINISPPEDWEFVHKLRSEIAAIGVGSSTILIDNPTLLTRKEYLPKGWKVHHPIKIVFDRRGRVNKQFNVFQNQDMSKTLWITKSKEHFPDIIKIKATSIEKNYEEINTWLDDRNISGDVLIEGGAMLINEFLETGLIRELRIFRSNTPIPGGTPLFNKTPNYRLILDKAKKLGPGIEEYYQIEL